MVIGQKLRELREAKKMSQGDIEHRTGLLRAYTSRVENGHTVPTLMTLEKYAGALGVPVYRFFTDDPVKKPKLPASESDAAWGSSGKNRREFHLFAKAFVRIKSISRFIKCRHLESHFLHSSGTRRYRRRSNHVATAIERLTESTPETQITVVKWF
jgi:transcriptional regulator with XRE-family HTH domain